MSQTNKQKAVALGKVIEPAVNAVLLAKAFALTERERMNQLDTALLAEFEIFTTGKHDRPVRRVLKESELYLADLDSAIVKEYYAERQYRINELGYKLPEGHCPACVAESLQRDAEHLLIKCAEPFFKGVTLHTILGSKNGLENLRKYLDLLCGLVVSLPGYKNPLTQQRVAA